MGKLPASTAKPWHRLKVWLWEMKFLWGGTSDHTLNVNAHDRFKSGSAKQEAAFRQVLKRGDELYRVDAIFLARLLEGSERCVEALNLLMDVGDKTSHDMWAQYAKVAKKISGRDHRQLSHDFVISYGASIKATECLLQERQPDSAIQYLEEIRKAGDGSQFLVEIAEIYASSGRFDKAEAYFETALVALRNSNACQDAPSKYGRFLLGLGRPAEVVDRIEQFVHHSMQPEHSIATAADVSEAYFRLGQYDKAESVLVNSAKNRAYPVTREADEIPKYLGSPYNPDDFIYLNIPRLRAKVMRVNSLTWAVVPAAAELMKSLLDDNTASPIVLEALNRDDALGLRDASSVALAGSLSVALLHPKYGPMVASAAATVAANDPLLHLSLGPLAGHQELGNVIWPDGGGPVPEFSTIAAGLLGHSI